MADYLTLACQYLEVDESQVIGQHIDKAEGEMVILVDRGVLGIPKYRLPLAELDELNQEEIKEEGPDYEPMSYKDLRIMARSAKIPNYAKMKKSELIKALQDLG